MSIIEILLILALIPTGNYVIGFLQGFFEELNAQIRQRQTKHRIRQDIKKAEYKSREAKKHNFL